MPWARASDEHIMKPASAAKICNGFMFASPCSFLVSRFSFLESPRPTAGKAYARRALRATPDEQTRPAVP
jgi:hypothetical protein